MIDPKELRIGNWIMDIEPHTLQFQAEYRHLAKMVESNWPYRSIALTPEILEACGFEEDTATYYTDRNFEMGNYSMWLGSGEFYIGENMIKPVKHLHQLQNLFHSLTGQELTVNLPSNQSA